MTPKTCDRCGHPHDPNRCSAHSKATGRQCALSPIKGGKTCHKHGSATARARAAGKRHRAEVEARATVAVLGLPRDIDPASALLEEVARTAGAVAWLEVKVRDLDDHDLVWGITKTKDGGEDRGTTYEAKPNAWYSLLLAERKHLVDVCARTLKAGVEERQVRVAEQQGAVFVAVIHGILGDLRLTGAQQKLVATVVPRHLRQAAIDGQAVAG